MTNADKGTLPRRSLAQVWRHPGYRSVLVSLVLSGISVSAYVPLLSLFLVQTLRVSDASVGLFTLTFLAAPVVGILVGRFSDRLRSRVPLLVAVAGWLALGRLAMGLAPTFPVALAVGVVSGALTAVPNAQIFAILKELLQQAREPRQAGIASTIRAGYALGWVVGPPLGSLLAAALGYRVALAATGLLVLIPLLPLRRLAGSRIGPSGSDPRPDTPPRPDSDSGPDRPGTPGPTGGGSLWVFATACLLALTGEAIRLSYLPVLAVDRLDVSLRLFGVLLAVAPVIELGAMPAAGALADRFGPKTVIFGGLLIGAGGFTSFAGSAGVAGLLLGQVLNAGFTAVLLGLGMTYAQRLHPGGAGFSTSVFFAAQSLSPVTAGLLGSGLADRAGLATLFLVSALLCAGAAALLLLTRAPVEPIT